MIVSWNWLKDYLTLDMNPAEVENRLAMSGLNHESSESVGDDLAIDLEVTSNRPDCLGHIGIAREIAVLWERQLKVPAPAPKQASFSASNLAKVDITCPELCYRYTARVIRGVKIGPSPAWLADRLSTIGIASVNSVVDITNYVLMECGQPLHAFDLDLLAKGEIIVREATKGEEFQAIDHKTYQLEPGMCVIADARGAIALGGVMGGAESEVSSRTTDLLIESAQFDPLSIRNTARKLNLHSPSSYRFERGIDPAGVDWASRRCCELILDLAGGELAEGVVDVRKKQAEIPPVVLRFSQIKRILGIDVPADKVQKILTDLGNELVESDGQAVSVVPPSWRRDLTREIDLIEEVARIHGYDKIPEDAAVPMVPSHQGESERVLAKVRHVLTASGFDEALTLSIVREEWSSAFSPWTDSEPVVSNTPVLRGADRLRTSLIPSLLGARKENEALANPDVELFETAKVYLPGDTDLPNEELMVGIVSGRGFSKGSGGKSTVAFKHVKGVVESLVAAINPTAKIETFSKPLELLDSRASCGLRVDGEDLAYIGVVSDTGLKRFNLRTPTAIVELRMAILNKIAVLIPQHSLLSSYPAISQDLNLIVDESIRWADVEATVRSGAGELLEEVGYRETYRDPKAKDGQGKKRLIFSITLRSSDRTLTKEHAEQIRNKVIAECESRHGAKLLA